MRTQQTYPIKIELPLSDLLPKRKNTIRKECYLELHERRVFYKVVGSYEHPREDDDKIWEEYKANYRWSRKRANISHIGMFYDNVFKTYAVELEFAGSDNSLNHWHFKDPNECLEVFNILEKYDNETKK